jgi:hypothetical protein
VDREVKRAVQPGRGWALGVRVELAFPTGSALELSPEHDLHLNSFSRPHDQPQHNRNQRRGDQHRAEAESFDPREKCGSGD